MGAHPHRRLVVLDVAGLGWNLIEHRPDVIARYGIALQPIETVFPALTCPVQASFRTGVVPDGHGMVANGFYARRLARALFWEQSASLVFGDRIWRRFRARGNRVAMLFWQQSLGEEVDIVLSPRPIHRHHGGMIPDCQSQPAEFYAKLCAELGRPFPLDAYWGPRASLRSSEWITDAICYLLDDADTAPDLLLAYLPHLDYDQQRYGPNDLITDHAVEETLRLVSRVWAGAREIEADVVIFGDYAMVPVTGHPIYPALALRRAGLFQVRNVRGRLYPNFFDSRAVVLADHELAVVYARDVDSARQARRVLEALDGVALLLDTDPGRVPADRLPDRPDFIAVASEGRWMAYPWWEERHEEPDFAAHVDIHSKPGYDPCELLFGRWPWRISTDPTRIRGTHGRAGPTRLVAWASTLTLQPAPDSVLDLSRRIEQWLNNDAPR